VCVNDKWSKDIIGFMSVVVDGDYFQEYSTHRNLTRNVEIPRNTLESVHKCQHYLNTKSEN
jgi:hypothetical protein